MGSYRYSAPRTENTAAAVGSSLPISTKTSTDICKAIRGLPLIRARKLLQDAIALKRAIPMKRYGQEIAHHKGMGRSKYPVAACTHIMSVLASAEANAQFKGLHTGNLVVQHISAQRGPTTKRYGRHPGEAKRTHLEVILAEGTVLQKKNEKKKNNTISKEKTEKVKNAQTHEAKQ